MFAIAVYTAVICPTLKTVAIPLEEDTYSDRIEAVRVLAAANVIIMICLGLILTLQVCFRPLLYSHNLTFYIH